MKVRTKRNVNIRRGMPSTTAERVGIILTNNELEVEGFVTGESIEGNSKWYYDIHKNYYWSGGIEPVISNTIPSIAEGENRPVATGLIGVNYNDDFTKNN